MGDSLILIQQGEPTIIETAITFLGTGSAGDPTACRRLVFPASVSPLLAPIVYAIDPTGHCLNPSRTLNLDNRVLPHPRTAAVETLGTTKVVRFETGDDDVIVSEIWEAQGGSPMPTSFFRLLYDYLINAAQVPPAGPDFIQWEPRDRTDLVYAVVLLSLSVGGGGPDSRFDVADVKADSGTIGPLDNALAGLNTTPTGLIDRDVTLRMKIVGEVV